MIKNEDFLKMFEDRDAEISTEELEKIIETELQKPEDRTDTDLIEMCLDEIKGKTVRQARKNVAKRRPKVAAAAVAAVLFLCGIVTASAVLEKDNFENIFEFYKDKILIHFDYASRNATEYGLTDSALAKELSENGISPVFLPEALTGDEAEIISVRYSNYEEYITADITFLYNGTQGSMTVTKYNFENIIPKSYDKSGSQKLEVIERAGVYVFVIGKNRESVIFYQEGLVNYEIRLQLDFDEAKAFAQTVK